MATNEEAAASVNVSKSVTSRSRKKRSPMWDHFDEKKVGGVCIGSICHYCKADLKYDVNTTGTSTMIKHLKSCVMYPQNTDKKQKLLSSVFNPIQGRAIPEGSLGTWKFNQELCRQMLARMIIVDEQPFSLVERPGFRDFISTLQPLFKHISRFTVARDCMRLYVTEKRILKLNLKNVKSRIALTTDIWTSIQNQSYMCLTAHFIDDDWKLHKRILNFVMMPSHKGRDIGKMVEQCILEWELKDNISTLTVDNASSNDVAVKYLQDKWKSVLVLGGEFFHVRCAAHILNLIVRDGLKDSDDSIVRIRNAIKYVRSSPMRAKAFQECIVKEGIPHKGSVCLDVSTRWNSTYLMIESALKFKQAFVRLEDDDDVGFHKDLEDKYPTSRDWEKASSLALFLRRFYAATKRMSGSLYVTSDGYFNEIVSILSTLKACEKDSNLTLKLMATLMREKFDKYYGKLEKTNVMVLIAAILDPRCKLRYLKYWIGVICDDTFEAERMIEHVRSVLDRIYTFYEQKLEALGGGGDEGKVDDMDFSFPSLSEDSGTSSITADIYEPDMLRHLWNEQNKIEQDGSFQNELDKYLEEKCEAHPKGTNFDLLAWWKEKGRTYKVLSMMARDILAIPISTVASESAFSTSGRVLDQFRSSLSTNFVEALICGQDWLRGSSSPITLEQYMEDADKYEELGNIVEEMADVADGNQSSTIRPDTSTSGPSLASNQSPSTS